MAIAPRRYAVVSLDKKKNWRNLVFPVNTVVFYILALSMLIAKEETGRWRVVAVAIASILVQASVRELVPGLTGAVIAVVATVVFVAVALITWCDIERRMALKIVGAYFGCSIVLSLFSAILSAQASAG
ncbi:MAG: hypothetical protein JSR66_33850 [Proteobacteria bacterium]|nr:hypothetical protein [Pseudomonadota bacterium]